MSLQRQTPKLSHTQGDPTNPCHKQLTYTAPGGMSIFTAPSCAPSITNVVLNAQVQVEVQVRDDWRLEIGGWRLEVGR